MEASNLGTPSKCMLYTTAQVAGPMLSHVKWAKYWWQNVLSALEIFLSMCYINLHFTYLLTSLKLLVPTPSSG